MKCDSVGSAWRFSTGNLVISICKSSGLQFEVRFSGMLQTLIENCEVWQKKLYPLARCHSTNCLRYSTHSSRIIGVEIYDWSWFVGELLFEDWLNILRINRYRVHHRILYCIWIIWIDVMLCRKLVNCKSCLLKMMTGSRKLSLVALW